MRHGSLKPIAAGCAIAVGLVVATLPVHAIGRAASMPLLGTESRLPHDDIASERAAVLGDPVETTRLEALRGGDSVENTIDIDGTVDGNSANRIISGDNLVQGGAFGNAAGINTLIQNTGSNVLIQNGMTVNVQFADPGP